MILYEFLTGIDVTDSYVNISFDSEKERETNLFHNSGYGLDKMQIILAVDLPAFLCYFIKIN